MWGESAGVFEKGEDVGGADEVADSAGAEGGVLQSGPAFGEEGKAAFAEAAQCALEVVVAAVVNAEDLPAGGLPRART